MEIERISCFRKKITNSLNGEIDRRVERKIMTEFKETLM